MDASNPRSALEALVSQSGEGFAALSRMLGRNEAYLQQFVRRGSPRRLAERDRKMLAAYLGVEEVVLGGPPLAAANDIIAVRRLDAVASAGPGGLADDDRVLGQARFERAFLDRLGVRAASVSILRARGDSMLPLIEDGDELLIDEADRRPGAREGVFVIRMDGGLMVKSVEQAAGGMICVASRNPAYPLQRVRQREVDVIGRVVWLSRALP